MIKINAFSLVLNQKVKIRFLYGFPIDGTGGLGISYSSRKMRGKVLNFI
jgi:hypothetical protein